SEASPVKSSVTNDSVRYSSITIAMPHSAESNEDRFSHAFYSATGGPKCSVRVKSDTICQV
ncbi:MAG: hypothetical protein R3C11_27800, partial [Planctomycetaceae bacterium]